MGSGGVFEAEMVPKVGLCFPATTLKVNVNFDTKQLPFTAYGIFLKLPLLPVPVFTVKLVLPTPLQIIIQGPALTAQLTSDACLTNRKGTGRAR